MTTIDQELSQVYVRLDSKQFGWFPDMDGTLSLYVEPDDEAEQLLARGEMLTELLMLKKPLIGNGSARGDLWTCDLGTDWPVVMHMGACPCPGVPREMWDHEWAEQQMQEGW